MSEIIKLILKVEEIKFTHKIKKKYFRDTQ